MYVLFGDNVDGVMKVVCNPPSNTVRTLAIDELPRSVPPVAIVDDGPEPVPTKKSGKLPLSVEKVITQRRPYTDIESCV